MALNPIDSPTKTADDLRKAALKEIEDNGVHGILLNTKDAFLSVATKFNEIHDLLVGAKSNLSVLCETEEKLRRELKPLIGGDISYVVRAEHDTSAKDAEDETRFSTLLGEVASSPDKMKALATLVKLSGLIQDSLGSWKSKRDKLTLRRVDDGSSASEFEGIQKKIDSLNYVIEQLETRYDTTSQTFFTIANLVEKRLGQFKKTFKPKFTKG